VKHSTAFPSSIRITFLYFPDFSMTTLSAPMASRLS
jgi:hypothetical protein